MKTSTPPSNPFTILESFLASLRNNNAVQSQEALSQAANNDININILNSQQKRDVLRVADTLFETSMLESSLAILEHHQNVLDDVPSVRKLISSEYNRIVFLVRGNDKHPMTTTTETRTTPLSMYSQMSTATTTTTRATISNYYVCLLNLNEQHYCNCRSFFEKTKDRQKHHHHRSVEKQVHYCKHILAVYLAQAFQCSSYQEEIVNEEEFANIYLECVK